MMIKIKSKFHLILALGLMSMSLRAEYRVYQYVVKAQNPFSINQKAYMVTSTLDPQSYLSYHGGPSTLKIDLIRTWMCRVNTAKAEYCESPYSKLNREMSSSKKDRAISSEQIDQREGV